jgi:hypothetical protein
MAQTEPQSSRRFTTAITRTQQTRSRLNALLAGIALVCACLVAASAAKAQGTTAGGEGGTAARLLTAKEGRAIVNVAWQQELPVHGARDCSHLVHEIYAAAGFGYPYASSIEIYAGTENFARVKYPHPGDLIAWPGHVGIVVDPLLHSFYSLVRTGLEEQDYTSPYWKSRGRPRFFRFRVDKGAVLMAVRTPNSPSDATGRKAAPAGPTAENREEDDPDGRSSDRPPNATPKRTLAKSAMQTSVPSAANHSVDVISEDEGASTANSSSERPDLAGFERHSTIYGPPAPRVANDLPIARNEDAAPFAIPKSVIVVTAGKTPARQEVQDAISKLSDAFGSVLQNDDPFHAAKPVVILEQFNVEKVQIKRDQGWAQVAIDSKASIGVGAVQLKRRHERVRWELRRTESGWEALTPTDRTYVPHDVAVKNLAAQLARIAASDDSAQHRDATLRQEAQLAGVLSVLLENK